MTELLAASADQTLLGSHYEDVRELLWGLKGTLNKTTGGKTTHRDACSLIEMISCPNDKVKAILRAQVADQLVHRGCETRETEVCEAMAANHMGMKVCGISCITNMAAGISQKELNHKEVQETADRVAKSFKELVTKVVVNM